jgi:hypothetical protein
LTASPENFFTAFRSEAILSANVRSTLDVRLSFNEGTLSKLQPVYDINPHETASAISRFQIFIRSRNYTNVHFNIFSAPTLEIILSCKTRNTLACAEDSYLSISSRKIVPLSAASNLPARSFTADVNAPLHVQITHSLSIQKESQHN